MYYNNKKKVIQLHYPDILKNYIKIEHKYYLLLDLNNMRENQGSNSCIFILHDPDDELEDKIIKICRYPLHCYNENKQFYNKYNDQRIRRFIREIKALKKAEENKKTDVIKIFTNNKLKINNKTFLCYVMEKGDSNLTNYIFDNIDSIDIEEKVLLCMNILKGIEALHSLGIYHRDIKPDNIIMIDNTAKISDLGLIVFREKDKIIDIQGERIGPYGWLSPEVMNKALTEKIDKLHHDCTIDNKSDIFQLGKLFWFIFNGNIPIGQIENSDFIPGHNVIFEIIKNMVQYSKSRRSSIHKINEQFEEII